MEAGWRTTPCGEAAEKGEASQVPGREFRAWGATEARAAQVELRQPGGQVPGLV